MNFYIDESCHLLNDGSDYMVLGVLFCEKKNVKFISNQIKKIKTKHGIANNFEIKSTKVSDSKPAFYMELLNFFLKCSYVHYRAIVIDKRKLQHKQFDQTHDDFYYKMAYLLMTHINETYLPYLLHYLLLI